MIKTYKYKLKLNKSQAQKLKQWLGVTRLIYNVAKARNEYVYKATEKSLSAYDLQKEVVQLKKEFDWMKELPKDTLNAPLFRLEKSMKAFFNGTARYPNWAKKKFWKSLVFIQQNKTGLRIENGKIKLHKDVCMRYFNSRDLPKDAQIKIITVIKEIDGWYASIRFKTEIHRSIPAGDNQVVGIDWGVSRFLTLSNGLYYENPRWFQQHKERLKKEQQRLSAKKKGSSNWEKQVKKLARLQRHIARKRLDWQHKISTDLIRQYAGFVVENLNIKGMTKSAKGTHEKPGKNVKAKSGLNREILSTAPSQFVELLKYKSEWNGRYFKKVNPAYTSQTCIDCGHVSKENRQSQSEFICVNCGTVENADIVAAKNILGRDATFSQSQSLSYGE